MSKTLPRTRGDGFTAPNLKRYKTISTITIQTTTQAQDKALRAFLHEMGITEASWLTPVSAKEQREIEALLNARTEEDRQPVERRIRKAA